MLCNGDGPPGSWGKLMRSRDYGAHWEDARLPGQLQSSAWCVATNKADPKLIFAATALGQYFRSQDGGELDRAATPPHGDPRARVGPGLARTIMDHADKPMTYARVRSTSRTRTVG